MGGFDTVAVGLWRDRAGVAVVLRTCRGEMRGRRAEWPWLGPLEDQGVTLHHPFCSRLPRLLPLLSAAGEGDLEREEDDQRVI